MTFYISCVSLVWTKTLKTLVWLWYSKMRGSGTWHVSSDACNFVPLIWANSCMWSFSVASLLFIISYHTVGLVLNSLLIVDFFFYFILSPHSKDFSLLLAYSSVFCKDTSVRSVRRLASLCSLGFRAIDWLHISIFMWLSFKMDFAGCHWIQFYYVTNYTSYTWQVWGKMYYKEWHPWKW